MNRFTFEQCCEIYWKFCFQNKHKIDRKLYENVVQNLVAEKNQYCPVNASLLLRFVKLGFIVNTTRNERARTVHSTIINIEAVLKTRHRSQELNISRISLRRIL